MKKINILYWIFTILFAGLMLFSAIPDVLIDPRAVTGFAEIGLTAKLIPFLGWAKVLGVIVILIPGFPRLKEWAYAGLMIDLVGATYLIMVSGKTVGDWAFMALPIALGFTSYFLYHRRQAMRSTTTL